MTSFRLTSQAGLEDTGTAARKMSLHAALPFLAMSGEVFTYMSTTVFILFIIFLVHAEIRRTRERTRKDEEMIEEERNVLEKRIAERTKELITAEAERLHELSKTARLGELSRGLFHDLMSPLTAVSLYLERLGTQTAASKEAGAIIEKVVGISKRMNSYMDSVRRCIGNAEELTDGITAKLSIELGIIRDVLGYKARMAGVTILIDPCPEIVVSIHPVRLHQLLLNLAGNAIDACIDDAKIHDRKKYAVRLTAEIDHENVRLRVTDNGCGMNDEEEKKLFKKSFTTKEKGLGIGLMTVKTIVEDELHGTISVQSSAGKGSTFIVTFPLKSVF